MAKPVFARVVTIFGASGSGIAIQPDLVDTLGRCCRFPSSDLIFEHVSMCTKKPEKGVDINETAKPAIATKSNQGKTIGRIVTPGIRERQISSDRT